MHLGLVATVTNYIQTT